MPFWKVRSETQTAKFGIWTQVADFIFYDDNRYAKYASARARASCVYVKRSINQFVSRWRYADKFRYVLNNKMLPIWLTWVLPPAFESHWFELNFYFIFMYAYRLHEGVLKFGWEQIWLVEKKVSCEILFLKVGSISALFKFTCQN